VEVWDNGPGIPDEEREAIFDAFYTTKQPGQGTGLGLHISRQIVEKCGGQISAEKPENGKTGARFVVLLPALEK
ncbi:MAG: HAMP domain-containing histidine kinase, partial [Anaerolineae bacterium]